MKKLKQRLVAISSKLRRYKARTEQHVQNRMFQKNQANLFERLGNKSSSNDLRAGSQ